MDEHGSPLYCHDGRARLGRGLAVSTFRKHYHALRTLHVHFQREAAAQVQQYLCVVFIVVEPFVGR